MGPAVKFDFRDQFWLDPDRRAGAALFLRDGLERRLGERERLELAIKRARTGLAKSGAGASGIAQSAVVVDTEHQRADRMLVRGRWRETGNDELLPVRAFGLDPVVAAA